MPVTAEDYKQWYDTYWVGSRQSAGELVESFKQTVTALKGSDAPRFLELTGGQATDGLHLTAQRAEAAGKPALRRLQELAFDDDQRNKASASAIGTSDEAIRELDGLVDIVDNVLAGLVRGVRLENEAVKEDAAEIATVAQSGITDRLQEALNTVENALDKTGRAVEALIGLPQGELYISEPEEVAGMSVDRVDGAVVDKWNELALKSLGEGDTTSFYQVSSLLFIDAKEPTGVQPYLEWAKKEADTPPDAEIICLKRGGAFDTGRIKAVGVKYTSAFEDAIKRVSKKKIEY